MEYGILSLIPPILALIIALMTKKVSLALIIGIFSGMFIMNGWNPIVAATSSIQTLFEVCADIGNLKVLVFTSLMGAFVLLIRVSGGVDGFVNYLTIKNKKIKSKTGAMLLAYVIGLLIFIDGLMGIMFKGTVTLPIFDRYKISREKLAWISDSTSAPVNALIPLNSWGAMLSGLIGAQVASGIISGDPMGLLIQSLPFQFYNVVTLLFVLFIILTGKDFGPMKKAELRVQTTGALYDEGVTPLMKDEEEDEILVAEGQGKMKNMAVPLAILITFTFLSLLYTGSGNIIKGDGSLSIVYATIITLGYMCISYARQNIMNPSEFVNYIYKGVSGMLSLVVLLVLAFAIGKTVSTIGTGPYLASLVEGKVSGSFGPALIFLFGAVMSFSTGTSWGTFSLMMPIAIPMAVAMNANIVLSIAAVVSGGIFGDHCSPMSDTTILASSSSGTDLFSHFKTQTPYALVCASISFVLFIVFGLIM